MRVSVQLRRPSYAEVQIVLDCRDAVTADAIWKDLTEMHEKGFLKFHWQERNLRRGGR